MNIQAYSRGTLGFTNTLGYIKRNDANLCQNVLGNLEVNPNYIHDSSFTKADYVLVLRSAGRQKRGQSIRGFALLQDKKDHFYLDVICASGGGKQLLLAVEKLAKKSGKVYIMLNALPAAINVYRRMNYRFSELSCIEDPIVTTLSNVVKNTKFTSSNNAIEDKQFTALLKRLITLKLTATKTCKNVKKCSIDGYTMTKCII